jgi:hypothetical protein
MANRLRSTTGRVSFIAFLDMITTVTGVLLLVTLLLTLYLNDPPATAAEKNRDASKEELQQARAALDAKLEELRQRQLQAAGLTNRVFVVPDANPSGKEPVLIVLSATNGWCTRLGQTNAVEFQVRADNADFERMLDSWNKDRERLVFYIRPSAIATFQTCKTLAASRSFHLGYDSAEEDIDYVLATP